MPRFHRPLALLGLLLFTAAAAAQTTPATPDPRIHVPLLDNWKFYKGAAAGAEAIGFNDDAWEKISIPHTWNALDGEDGGNNYYKGDGWYRRHITIDDSVKGKELYLRFEAINRKADIYVNGTLLGSHAGGMAAICLDATKLLHPGDNLLVVRASNRVDQDMPPLQADFTFFGGIYRPAELVAMDSLHFSATDFASPGIYITTPNVNAATALVTVRSLVESSDTAQRQFAIRAQIFDGENEIARVYSAPGPLAPGKSREMNTNLVVPQPHLWNGRDDPHLYQVRVSVLRDDVVVDSVTQPLGIRTTAIDPVRGFLLNGKPYDLHGVDRHQDRQDKGWAISNADHLQDMALIKEMGCTAIRLAHYQHSQFFYDLCDKEGMVVWAEIPVVDKLGNTDSGFTANAKQQYTELIRQNFNHPSIAFWSAGNEVDDSANLFNRNGPQVYPWFKAMSELGHKEDPSRLTASAWREKFFPPAGTTDVIGLNEYLGWYTGGGPNNNSGWEGLEAYIANHSDPAKGGIKGTWAVTEYGAGASIYYHSEKPVRLDHSEEYQALLHENTWKVFAKHPEIWGKFVWNMFDFAVDSRAEGDHAGRNDKGLVTYDRQTKKDAFYFYKAVWSKEPTLQIASKRFTVRGIQQIPIKVYTNATQVKLLVNGVALSIKTPDNGTALWEGVPLQVGANEVRVTGIADGPSPWKLDDTCTWTYTPGAPITVFEPQDDRMRQAQRPAPAAGR